MPRGVGKALRERLAGAPPATVPARGEALLLNEARRLVLDLLCRRPGLTSGAVARALGMSPNAAAWHVQKLVEGGYLARASTEAAVPAGLVTPAEIPFFLLLAQESVRSALAVVVQEPGRSQEEVAAASGTGRQTAGRVLARLTADGLVSVLRDGRANRYYPMEALAARREAQAAQALAFSEQLLERIRAEGIAPQILRRNREELLVRLGDGPEAPVLHLRTDPYATALV